MTALPAPSRATRAGGTDLVLYGLVLLGWGTSWVAIPPQLGVVPPEYSVAYRFAIATAVMFAWTMIARQRLAFPWRVHMRFLLLGVFMFSSNFVLGYYAGEHLTSGLIAVVYSTATVWNLVLARLFFGATIGPRLIVAAAMGLAGIVLVFWPEITGASFSRDTLIAIGYALAGSLCFSLGNMVSRANQPLNLPMLSSTTWGMAYGVLLLVLAGAARGLMPAWDPRPIYLAAVLFHAVFATILAFSAYLSLLARIGPERAGYATVVFPVIALLLSTLVEGYHWTPFAALGLGFIIAGNVVILTGRGG